jgi:hypothetical protein
MSGCGGEMVPQSTYLAALIRDVHMYRMQVVLLDRSKP